MKSLSTLKPRNPYAPAAARRAAGSHRPRNGALRQRQRNALRIELQRLKPSP